MAGGRRSASIAPSSTNCERVGLALAHKGIEAQSVLISYDDRGPVEAISGQGLVPVIEDAGEVVNDSVAILRHLERRWPEPALFPADPAAGAEVDVFIDWFERVYKAAPNELEDQLERDDPDEGVLERRGAEMRRGSTSSSGCSRAASTCSGTPSAPPTASPTRS